MGPAVPALQQILPHDGPCHTGGNHGQEDDGADVARAKVAITQIQCQTQRQRQIQRHQKNGEDQRVFQRQVKQRILEKRCVILKADGVARTKEHVAVLERVDEHIYQRNQDKKKKTDHLREDERIAARALPEGAAGGQRGVFHAASCKSSGGQAAAVVDRKRPRGGASGDVGNRGETLIAGCCGKSWRFRQEWRQHPHRDSTACQTRFRSRCR